LGVPREEPGVPPAPTRRLPANQRREQLMDVALHLFAERGFAATTMDDIADAAGVTKPLLYQHFASKRGLYLELVDSLSQTVIEAIDQATSEARGPRQQVEQGFAAYFHLLHTRTAAFRLLSAPDVQKDEELSEAGKRIADIIAEQTAELIDAGLDPEHRLLLGYAVVGMVENAGRHFLGEHSDHHAVAPAEVDRLSQRLADLAWAGLRTVHDDR
jgi:AcrR family transcriptional regulator